ncbi:MAG: dihydrolipoyl dehydrogenase [Candidatus Omnitrophota bacterium]|nr:dihydrolipoyl dehydrogenase [Candidatus Omnitrophota bacterium]
MYDLCVIGSGWAGFNASLRASELGAKVCLIEKDAIGGTCLNRGCIPTKVLVHSCRLIKELPHYQNFGIQVKDFSVSFEAIQSRKNQIVLDLQKGLGFELAKQKIEIRKGQARIISPVKIEVDGEAIEAKFIIIASGSRPQELSSLRFNQSNILSSDELLDLKVVPKSLLIVGGGAIGCEFASVFSALKSEVTIVEVLEHLLPLEDLDVSKKIEMVFKKNGIKILTKTTAQAVNLQNFEKVLVCVGRALNTEDLLSGDFKINSDKNKIAVNEFLQTSIGNIYAAGDCIGGKLLAHVAAYEGTLAAENIFGKRSAADYSAVPNCTFTNPEVSSVGISEQQAIAQGRQILISRFDFLASGMARILGEAEGFIKLIADKNSDELLGACIVGPKACELIASLAVAIRNKLKSKDIYGTIFAHPTLSEGIHEAAKGLFGL